MLPTKDMYFRNVSSLESLGNKFPKSKVLTVFKLVKPTQVSFAGHKTVLEGVSQKYKIQIYCLFRPPTKKVSSLNSILTISRLKFENVTVTRELSLKLTS